MSTVSGISIASVRSPEDGDVVRELFVEYADSLGVDRSFRRGWHNCPTSTRRRRATF